MATYKKKRKKRVDAAPDLAVLKHAQRIVSRYRIILDTDPDGGFIGSSVELPTVFVDGETLEECVEATREALLGAVVAMIEAGQRVPSRGKRDMQVNVRLSADEKLTLLDAVQRLGLRSISDFIRLAALERCCAT